MPTRRDLFLALFASAAGAQTRRRPVAIFDSPIGRICDPSSMELAAKVGLDGVELHMGRDTDNLPLRGPELRATYKRLARQLGLPPTVKLGSTAHARTGPSARGNWCGSLAGERLLHQRAGAVHRAARAGRGVDVGV